MTSGDNIGKWDGYSVDCPCGRGPRRCPGQKCLTCHNEYSRKWNSENPGYVWKKASPLQKRKNRMRARVRSALRRGKIERFPCYHCGYRPAQVRVTNFNDPFKGLVFVCAGCRKDGY